jgi:hypothetical protein
VFCFVSIEFDFGRFTFCFSWIYVLFQLDLMVLDDV